MRTFRKRPSTIHRDHNACQAHHRPHLPRAQHPPALAVRCSSYCCDSIWARCRHDFGLMIDLMFCYRLCSAPNYWRICDLYPVLSAKCQPSRRCRCYCHVGVHVLTRHYSCCGDVTNGREYPPTQVQSRIIYYGTVAPEDVMLRKWCEKFTNEGSEKKSKNIMK